MTEEVNKAEMGAWKMRWGDSIPVIDQFQDYLAFMFNDLNAIIDAHLI